MRSALIVLIFFLSSWAPAATTSNQLLVWPNKIMLVQIEEDVPASLVRRVKRVVKRIDDLNIVHIKIIQKSKPTDSDESLSIVMLGRGGICKSGYGWPGPERSNVIRLDPDCSYGNILHEFLHALGLVHEHLHPQSNLVLYFGHIERSFLDQFQDTSTMALTDYDPDSIMNYSPYAFSICSDLANPDWDLVKSSELPNKQCRTKNWQKIPVCRKECATFLTSQGDLVGGQRVDLSNSDIEGLRKLYSVE